MNKYCSDVVIHIDETMSALDTNALAKEISFVDGVYSACTHEKTPHLMVVDFDPDDVRAIELLHKVTDHGLHAELIGL